MVVFGGTTGVAFGGTTGGGVTGGTTAASRVVLAERVLQGPAPALFTARTRTSYAVEALKPGMVA